MKLRANNKKYGQVGMVEAMSFPREIYGRVYPGELSISGSRVWKYDDVILEIDIGDDKWVSLNELIESYQMKKTSITIEGEWDSTSDENKVKLCSRCGIEKPITEFYRDRSQGDGVTRYCKDCLRKK